MRTPNYIHHIQSRFLYISHNGKNMRAPQIRYTEGDRGRVERSHVTPNKKDELDSVCMTLVLSAHAASWLYAYLSLLEMDHIT